MEGYERAHAQACRGTAKSTAFQGPRSAPQKSHCCSEATPPPRLEGHRPSRKETAQMRRRQGPPHTGTTGTPEPWLQRPGSGPGVLDGTVPRSSLRTGASGSPACGATPGAELRSQGTYWSLEVGRELEALRRCPPRHRSSRGAGGPSPRVALVCWVPGQALLLGAHGFLDLPQPGSWGRGQRGVTAQPGGCPRGQKEWETWEPGEGA